MKNFLFILLALGSHLLSFAQPGALDLSFDPGAGANYEIFAIALQSDGKIIIGGDFINYDNTPIKRIARLNSNGTLDSLFNIGTGANKGIYAVAIQSDKKILVGGDFRIFNGDTVNHIIRLNTDGSRDTAFHTGTGTNSRVWDIAIQPDDKILISGLFTTYNGNTCNRLARLNAEGSLDTTFKTTTGADGSIETIAIQPDGKIIIGGDFTTYGITHSVFDYTFRVARVNPDGSRDTTFSAVPGASHALYTIAIQPDGNILIGGNFTQYNLQPLNHIGRLNPGGGLSTKFYVIQGTNGTVNDIKIMPNGDIIFAGAFTTYNDTIVNRLVRVDTLGYINPTFNTGTGPDNSPTCLKLQPDGKILIAGTFTSYNGVTRNKIARIYNCLTPQPDVINGNDSVMCPGSAPTYSIAPVPDADRYEWTLPQGWMGSSDSNSIMAISNGQGGVISVRAFSDSCGYSAPQTKTVYRIQPPADPICLVTVDEQSTHNILIWEKTRTNLVDSFFIYRETSTNVYTKIASVPYDSLSEYHDYGANPNTTSYRYRLSALDICGVETSQSPFHNTIHLQNLGTGNFQWTFYQIENALNPVLSFNVYRDAFGNGNFFQIGNIPGTNSTFTDNSYASFPNSEYVVDANWGISCTPQRGTINTTRSNIRKINVIDIPVDTPHVGINALLQEDFEIYPNPAENTIILNFSSSANINGMKLFNSLGQIVWSEKPERTNGKAIKTIPVGELLKGVYVLAIETITGSVKRKVIVQ